MLNEELVVRFKGVQPLNRRLGFGSLSGFLTSLPRVKVSGQDPDLTVSLGSAFGRISSVGKRDEITLDQVRTEVVAHIATEGGRVKLVSLGQHLAKKFPSRVKLYTRLKCGSLADVLKRLGSVVIEKEEGLAWARMKDIPQTATTDQTTPQKNARPRGTSNRQKRSRRPLYGWARNRGGRGPRDKKD